LPLGLQRGKLRAKVLSYNLGCEKGLLMRVVPVVVLLGLLSCSGPTVPSTSGITVLLSVAGGTGGTATVDPQKEHYSSGESVSLVATPATGFDFLTWSGDVNSTQNPFSTVLSKSIQAQAHFAPFPVVTTTVTPSGAGVVVLNPSGPSYPRGTLVVASATANSGAYFDHWQGVSTTTEPVIDLTMDSDKNLTAVFGSQPQLTLGASPSEGGTVTSPAVGYSAPGTSATITATANTGYYFDHWEIDGQPSAVTGLSLPVTMNASHGVKAFFVKNEWTILLYISGGNDLAPQALATLKQLETVDLRDKAISVLALVDRAPGYDSGWVGTRLYDVQYDTSGKGLASSTQLDSTELGLSATQSSNLDMGDPNTLKNFIRHAKNHRAASHYGIVFWGHGTGWRAASLRRTSASVSRSVGPSADLSKPLVQGTAFKAVSVDDDNGSSVLYTTGLGQGLSVIAEGDPTLKFGFIGTDLCFGSMIEELDEIKAYGQYFVGSEGLVPTNGWRYDLALPVIRDLADRNPLAVSSAFFSAFQSTYKNVSGSTLSVVDLAQVDPLVNAWNSWSSAATSAIKTASLQSSVKATLFLDATSFYTTPGDLNLDMADATVRVNSVLSSASGTAVTQALANAVKLNFSTMTLPSGVSLSTSGIAVHFVPLDARGGYSLPHDDSYTQGKNALYTPLFVTTSTWVPSTAGNNFLDVLWYKVF
jgi:hypothetical protein